MHRPHKLLVDQNSWYTQIWGNVSIDNIVSCLLHINSAYLDWLPSKEM